MGETKGQGLVEQYERLGSKYLRQDEQIQELDMLKVSSIGN